jgi:hypothetical protein
MSDTDESHPTSNTEAQDIGKLFKAIRLVCCLLMGLSGGYAVMAALGIGRIARILNEMHNHSTMPVISRLVMDYQRLLLVSPIIITISGWLLILEGKLAHRTLYWTMGLMLLNLALGLLAQQAMFQPLLSIIERFNPGA